MIVERSMLVNSCAVSFHVCESGEGTRTPRDRTGVSLGRRIIVHPFQCDFKRQWQFWVMVAVMIDRETGV